MSFTYCRPFHEGVDWNHMEHRRLLWQKQVALFTRAWIEINLGFEMSFLLPVALFTRAWIEILQIKPVMPTAKRRPFHEGVDWNMTNTKTPIPTARSPFSRGRGLKFKARAAWTISAQVALFTRAWIEIHLYRPWRTSASSRPFHEGVDWNTIINKINSSTTESPFSRGRGLKSLCLTATTAQKVSPFSRGRGLKCIALAETVRVASSPFSRGRGLK